MDVTRIEHEATGLLRKRGFVRGKKRCCKALCLAFIVVVTGHDGSRSHFDIVCDAQR